MWTLLHSDTKVPVSFMVLAVGVPVPECHGKSTGVSSTELTQVITVAIL